MEKFHCDHIIPLGFFCSPAIELDKFGYRNASYPFDWVISDTSSVSKLISCKFDDLFNIEHLKEGRKTGSHIQVQHTKYKFTFFHDFKVDTPIVEQLELIKNKYQRRIDRFYNVLQSNDKIIFLLYENNSNQRDINSLVNNLLKYTKNFRLVIISNNDFKRYSSSKFILNQIFVKPDVDDVVCRKFFDNQDVLDKFQRYISFPQGKQIFNILNRGLNIELKCNTTYNLNEMDNKYTNLFFQGWSGKEQDGRWTVGQTSILNLIFSEHVKDKILFISFEIRKTVTNEKLIIFSNDELINYNISCDHMTISVPFAKIIKLRFCFEGKIKSPKDRGLNMDTRLLGYKIGSFSYRIESKKNTN